MVVEDRATNPEPPARSPRLEHFENVLEAPFPFYGVLAKHLLKDCSTMKGYIYNTLDQKGKA